VDARQARAFEDVVAESGDGLLRMATLLVADPDLAPGRGEVMSVW
jgi:hypothetical protein